MGVPVIIYGKSGSGKSRSLKNFDEDEILFVNIENKPLPFRKKFQYEWEWRWERDDTDRIIKQILKLGCKTTVIDDAGYLMTQHFMKHHRNKKGDETYEMFNEIADGMYFLMRKIKSELPADHIVYIIFHEDTNDFGDTKIRTIGKLIDSKVCLEGMVTVCIRCKTIMGQHKFSVKTEGDDITKAPEDMFNESEFENDLKFVDTTIREYYGFDCKPEKESEEKANEKT